MKKEQTRELDLTKGSILPLFARFTGPIFVSLLFQQLYNMADTLIVGRFLGTEALAAVASSGNLIFLLVSFFSGLSTGAGVVIARCFGAGDTERLKKAIHTNLSLSLLCGVLLTGVGMGLTPTFLRWMNTDPAVLPGAISYFRCYFAGALGLVIYNSCRGIMTAMGDSRRPLFYLIVSSLLNVGLDLLFVGPMDLNVWGAAFATVLAQCVSAALCLISLHSKKNLVPLRFSQLRFDRESLRDILKNGLPSGIQDSVIGFANVIVQSQINTFGAAAMAAVGTHGKIEGFIFLPVTSLNTTVTTFVSQNLGAGETRRARKGANIGILGACLLAEALGICYYLLAPQLISIFDSSTEVIRLGTGLIRTIALFYFLMAFAHSVAAVCRGAGRAFVPMAVMLIIWCLIRISILMVLMAFQVEFQTLFLVYPITWGLSCIFFLIYYLKADWCRAFEH